VTDIDGLDTTFLVRAIQVDEEVGYTLVTKLDKVEE